jgi:hypothetical protein
VVFASGARRDTNEGKGRYDLLPPLALQRVAQHYEAGAKKYEDRNWERGIPVSRMFDSMIRHAFQALSGERDEDHLAAVVFNALGIMEYEERAKRWPKSQYPDLFHGLGMLYAMNTRQTK